MEDGEAEEDRNSVSMLYDVDENCLEQIDTNQDYRQTLVRLMGQIYSKREQQLSRNSSKVMLLLFAAVCS